MTPVFIRKVSSDPIILVAEKMEEKIRRAFLDAIKSIRGTVALSKLTEFLRKGDVDGVLSVLALDKKFSDALVGVGIEAGISSVRDAVQATYAAGAKAATTLLPSSLSTKLSFDLMNPKATEFLNSYTFDLIRQISTESREAIQQTVLRAFKEGGHPYEQARRIKQSIGLTTNQERAVASYRASLESGTRDALNRSLRDARFDSTIERAIRSRQSLSRAQIDRMVSRYREKFIAHRARTIARTESLRASNTGQMALWRQARDQGLISGNAKRKWIISGDDRTCPICRGLNGKIVGLEEEFSSGIMSAPAHVTCRCRNSLVTVSLSDEHSERFASVPFEEPEEELEVLPVVESKQQKEIRVRQGYTKIVRVDAQAFAEAFQRDRGEALAWNPQRTERLKDVKTFDSYPKVYVNELGRVDVLDGRHRLATAAARGNAIDVAVPRGTVVPDEVKAN